MSLKILTQEAEVNFFAIGTQSGLESQFKST